MKTNLKNCLAGAAFIAVAGLSACGSSTKNASDAADSANKSTIAQTDSANKAVVANADSANKAKTELKEDASKFLVKSYESGLFEIALSKLAETNGLNADVKHLAAQLVTAHTGINDQMLAIAESANFKLPGDVDSDHAKTLADAAKLTGANFDKKYMDVIVSGHEKSVDNYKDAYKDLSDGDTKSFAGKTLPMIQDHLQMAKKVKERIK
ncbi:MAG: DUF4142 domain-containing protein [Bacteroidota bacterium]